MALDLACHPDQLKKALSVSLSVCEDLTDLELKGRALALRLAVVQAWRVSNNVAVQTALIVTTMSRKSMRMRGTA